MVSADRAADPPKDPLGESLSLLRGGLVIAAWYRALVPRPRQTERRERYADLAEDLDRDQEPGEQEHDAKQLAQLEQLRRAEAIEAVGDRRDKRPDRDEDRGRHAAVNPPRGERFRGAWQRRNEIDDDRDRRNQQVEEKMATRLLRVQ